MNLFLDDIRDPPGPGWTVARTAEQAREFLRTGNVDRASLDHDLGICARCTPGERVPSANLVIVASLDATCAKSCRCPCHETGYDLVKWMAEYGIWPREKPSIHSANPVGRANMQAVIDRHWSAP